jgi:hypothetical protein
VAIARARAPQRRALGGRARTGMSVLA